MKHRINLFLFMAISLFFLPKLSAQQEPQFWDEAEKTISMDFKDAELKDVFKIFSIQSGMNFIASEAVQSRTITLYLDKVPISEAMDKLFVANGLTYDLDRKANIFIVKDWGKPEIETVTRVFYLKFATVSTSSIKEEMSQQFKNTEVSAAAAPGGGETQQSGKWKQEEEAGITEVVKKLLSSQGSIMEDFRTNSLIVREIPSRMPIIAQVIAALDVPVPQVMLEIEMLDVSKNAVDQMGIKFPTSPLKLDMTTASRMTNLFGSKGTNGRDWTMRKEGLTDGGWDVGCWTASHFGPTIFSVINTQLTLDFLHTQSDTKFLARPRILTLNNEPAEIKISTEEAIGVKSTTGGAGSATTIVSEAERSPTGITLRVIPQINLERGEITMFIHPVVAEANSGGTFIGANGETINFKDREERSTKGIVKVKDGETVVVGGLIRNEASEIRTKVPLLGDIPLLGALFRHKNREKDRERELLIFITPHILKDSVSELTMMNKARLPEREQESSSGINRQETISNSLNTFEKNVY